MRLKLTSLLLALAFTPVAASAQSYYANVQLTIDNTAAGIGFTSTDILAGSGHPQVNSASCVSNSSGGDFRYRVDGTAPTSSVGVPVVAGAAITFSSTAALLNFKGIRTASTSAVLNCTLSDTVIAPVLPPVSPAGGGGGGGGGGSVTQGTVPWVVAGELAANGAPAAANRAGVLPCIVETGSLPTLNDGRDAPCYVNANGALFVTNPPATPFAITGFVPDNTASNFTAGSTAGSLFMGVYQSSPTTLTDGRAAVPLLSSNRVMAAYPTSAAGVALYPAAAPLADATANPTLTGTAAYMMAFNGSTWDRVRSSTDPCSGAAKTFYVDSQTTSTQLFTGTASNKTYICSILVTQASSSTQTFALVAGTGSVCATNTVGVIGDTSAANGAQVPFVLGNGAATVAKSTVNADNICLLQSGSDRLTVTLGYVVAP